MIHLKIGVLLDLRKDNFEIAKVRYLFESLAVLQADIKFFYVGEFKFVKAFEEKCLNNFNFKSNFSLNPAFSYSESLNNLKNKSDYVIYLNQSFSITTIDYENLIEKVKSGNDIVLAKVKNPNFIFIWLSNFLFGIDVLSFKDSLVVYRSELFSVINPQILENFRRNPFLSLNYCLFKAGFKFNYTTTEVKNSSLTFIEKISLLFWSIFNLKKINFEKYLYAK